MFNAVILVRPVAEVVETFGFADRAETLYEFRYLGERSLNSLIETSRQIMNECRLVFHSTHV